jgi:hypothetical protein
MEEIIKKLTEVKEALKQLQINIAHQKEQEQQQTSQERSVLA